MIKIRLGLCVMMMLTFVFSSLISLAPRYEYLAQILVDVNAEDGEQDSISHTSPETYGPRMELPPVVLPDGNDIESIATRAAYAHFRPYEKNAKKKIRFTKFPHVPLIYLSDEGYIIQLK